MGHGHVVPNADGTKARCGGPALCPECALEAGKLAGKSSSNPTPSHGADEIIQKAIRELGSAISNAKYDGGYVKLQHWHAEAIHAALTPAPETRAGLERRAILAGALRRIRKALYDQGELRAFISFKAVGDQYGERHLMDDVHAVLSSLENADIPPSVMSVDSAPAPLPAQAEIPEWVQGQIEKAQTYPEGASRTALGALNFVADRLAQVEQERKPMVTREAFTEALGDYLIAAMDDGNASPSTDESAARVNTAYDTLLRMAGIPSAAHSTQGGDDTKRLDQLSAMVKAGDVVISAAGSFVNVLFRAPMRGATRPDLRTAIDDAIAHAASSPAPAGGRTDA